MNIEEIRSEIPKAIVADYPIPLHWIESQTAAVFHSDDKSCNDLLQIAASMLVNLAYEAGVKRGGEIRMSALNDVELHENPVYQKGYEEGINKGLADGAAWASEVNQAALEFYDYKRGYDDAAKDPKAWYVLDKNGEPVHIGDTVQSELSYLPEYTFEVSGFTDDGITDSYGGWHRASYIEKVIPETREKIKEDLTDAIWSDWYESEENDTHSPSELAEQFISRIESLARP